MERLTIISFEFKHKHSERDLDFDPKLELDDTSVKRSLQPHDLAHNLAHGLAHPTDAHTLVLQLDDDDTNSLENHYQQQ